MRIRGSRVEEVDHKILILNYLRRCGHREEEKEEEKRDG